LVARCVASSVELGSVRTDDPARIMPRGERRGAEIARRAQQVPEFDPLVAADARHRRLAPGVTVDKVVDNRGPEAALVIEHIMRNAEVVGDARGIIDVAAGTAGAAAPRSRAMVVQLQTNADNVKPALDQNGRGHR